MKKAVSKASSIMGRCFFCCFVVILQIFNKKMTLIICYIHTLCKKYSKFLYPVVVKIDLKNLGKWYNENPTVENFFA